MFLRGKVIGVILGAFAVIGVLAYGVQQLFILPSFITLERDESIKDMGRAGQAIESEVQHLTATAADWSFWDDTYQYAKDGNDAYRNANLNEDTLAGLDANFLYIFNEHHVLRWGLVYDLENEQEIELPGLTGQLAEISISDPEAVISGLLLTERGPALIATRPILTTDHKGPASGYLVVGIFLDKQMISERASISLKTTPLDTLVPFDLPGTPDSTTRDAKSAELAELVRATREADATGASYLRQEADVTRVYRVIDDIFQKPALLLEVTVPRAISARGERATSFALYSLLGTGLVILLLLIGILEMLVLRPLRRLTDHAVRIGKHNDLTIRMAEDRIDEIGILSREFNTMLEQLAKARKDLMDQSYQSGRADVATGILHSVGNALNGVVTSSFLLEEATEKSCSGDVTRVADLLKEQGDELARFITEDSRGQMVPAYLASLGSALAKERLTVLDEARSLQDKISHIKDIIAQQQNFSREALADSTLLEPELPGELLEDALKLSLAQKPEDHVRLLREYGEAPRINVNRFKILQILLNLINNARQSCMKSDRQDKQIILRITADHQQVMIEIIDNGIGISPEALEKIFQKRGTVGKAGHGLSLHMCSFAAKELGGRLKVTSDGTGCGATSTLELPCLPANEKSTNGESRQ